MQTVDAMSSIISIFMITYVPGFATHPSLINCTRCFGIMRLPLLPIVAVSLAIVLRRVRHARVNRTKSIDQLQAGSGESQGSIITFSTPQMP